MVNRAVAKQVYKYLKNNPEKHAQGSWFTKKVADAKAYRGYRREHVKASELEGDEPNICGTTMCIAGATTFLVEGLEGLDYWTVGSNGYVNKEEVGIEKAREHLGLSREEAQILFYTMNNDRALAKLKDYAEGKA